MGKIIKDGFAFMEYVNAGLIRKIDDIPALKAELIALSEAKTHVQLSRYACLLGEHVLELGGLARCTAVEACFAANKKWQRNEAKFQEGRDAADVLNGLAREEKDPVRAKALRALGQVAATPHVRWHALAASEYAVVMVNLLHPGDFEAARRERETQIALLKSV